MSKVLFRKKIQFSFDLQIKDVHLAPLVSVLIHAFVLCFPFNYSPTMIDIAKDRENYKQLTVQEKQLHVKLRLPQPANKTVRNMTASKEIPKPQAGVNPQYLSNLHSFASQMKHQMKGKSVRNMNQGNQQKELRKNVLGSTQNLKTLQDMKQFTFEVDSSVLQSPDTPDMSSTVDPSGALKVIEGEFEAIKRCYNQVLLAAPNFRAHMEMSFIPLPGGKVDQMQIHFKKLEGEQGTTPMKECLRKVVSSLNFPANAMGQKTQFALLLNPKQ